MNPSLGIRVNRQKVNLGDKMPKGKPYYCTKLEAMVLVSLTYIDKPSYNYRVLSKFVCNSEDTCGIREPRRGYCPVEDGITKALRERNRKSNRPNEKNN